MNEYSRNEVWRTTQYIVLQRILLYLNLQKMCSWCKWFQCFVAHFESMTWPYLACWARYEISFVKFRCTEPQKYRKIHVWLEHRHLKSYEKWQIRCQKNGLENFDKFLLTFIFLRKWFYSTIINFTSSYCVRSF